MYPDSLDRACALYGEMAPRAVVGAPPATSASATRIRSIASPPLRLTPASSDAPATPSVSMKTTRRSGRSTSKWQGWVVGFKLHLGFVFGKVRARVRVSMERFGKSAGRHWKIIVTPSNLTTLGWCM